MVMLQFTVRTTAAKAFIADMQPVAIEVEGGTTLRVHVVNKYKHLGGIVIANGSMLEEVYVRAGSAHAAERALRKK